MNHPDTNIVLNLVAAVGGAFMALVMAVLLTMAAGVGIGAFGAAVAGGAGAMLGLAAVAATELFVAGRA